MTTSKPTSRPCARRRGAFTLIETALATVIIGVGVLAMFEAQVAFMNKNQWSTSASTATFLANEVRELTRGFTRHDVFAGGLYFVDPGAKTGFTGWGPELTETMAVDFDDIDDLDGAVFGNAADADLPGPVTTRLPGPVNAFAELIPETDWLGAPVLDADGDPAPLQGWSQYVVVEKVRSGDYSSVLADEYDEAGPPPVEVDDFPLRVTVYVMYQGPFELNAREVTRTVWVVPQ